MGVPKEIDQLVHRFSEQIDAYRRPEYKELSLRQEFLNPFFEALGWDVTNRLGYAEPYRDVVVEQTQKHEGRSRAPDYTFRIGGQTKFLVEAKKPAVNLKIDPKPALQLRRYAWTRKLPLSVLADFEELAVYDTRVEPRATDGAEVARILYVQFEDYAKHWQTLDDLLSREAVLKGRFDRFAESKKPRRGTSDVDDRFLEDLEGWRRDLAMELARQNHMLSARQINAAVQRILDRIVFLRIAEDRGLEPFGQLREAVAGAEPYASLVGVFKSADNRYNSGIFHFRLEKGRDSSVDDLTPTLVIRPKAIRAIVEGLYAPRSPYAFGVFPADVLGSVYERFLGNTIVLGSGHKTAVERKPELRKAKGVYYTPTHIVDFIVENAISRQLASRSLGSIKGFSILDPACGSGSFLLQAYQTLLNWYLEQYLQRDASQYARGRRPKLRRNEAGDWQLTTSTRKQILLDHIFGVDIDPQAVEVAKLSLLLKVLENESAEDLSGQFSLLHERALPDLHDNIRCGNSLVGPDVYDMAQEELFDPEAGLRINAFDWEEEFRAQVAAGGFDAVVGNPPYAYRNATEDALRDYYRCNYRSAEGNFELYKFFLERSVRLAKPSGRVGMIVSASFLVQPSFEKIRRILAEECRLHVLAPLGPKAFKDATVDTTIVVVQPGRGRSNAKVEVRAPEDPTALAAATPYRVSQRRFATNPMAVFDYRVTDEGAPIIARLLSGFPDLESRYEIGVGINTGYIRDDLTAEHQVDDRYHPMVKGSGIVRYGGCTTEGWILYDADVVRSYGDQGRTLPAERLLSRPKILVVRTRNLAISPRIVATLDEAGLYNLNRLSNVIARGSASLEGLLGVLNSRVFEWLFSTRYYDYEIKPVYLRQCPIPDTNDHTLVDLVKERLKLGRRSRLGQTSHDHEQAERRVDAIEDRIDRRVMELFSLSAEEREIIGS